jgi:hypothetical protein
LRPPIASPAPPIWTKASLVVAHIQISLGPRYLNHQCSWVDIPFFQDTLQSAPLTEVCLWR